MFKVCWQQIGMLKCSDPDLLETLQAYLLKFILGFMSRLSVDLYLSNIWKAQFSLTFRPNSTNSRPKSIFRSRWCFYSHWSHRPSGGLWLGHHKRDGESAVSWKAVFLSGQGSSKLAHLAQVNRLYDWLQSCMLDFDYLELHGTSWNMIQHDGTIQWQINNPLPRTRASFWQQHSPSCPCRLNGSMSIETFFERSDARPCAPWRRQNARRHIRPLQHSLHSRLKSVDGNQPILNAERKPGLSFVGIYQIN